MAVKIFIKRKVPAGREEQLIELIKKLRSMAVAQPGYISGETLMSTEDQERYLVISTWQTKEDWSAWEGSRERMDIQQQIDDLSGEKTTYESYHHPLQKGARLSGFKGWEGG